MWPPIVSCSCIPLLALVAATAVLLTENVPLVRGVDGSLPALHPFCSGPANRCVSQPLRVGAWNLQRFGVAKVRKPGVLDVIVEVVRRFDLIVLMEVTDSSGTSIPALIAAVNEGLEDEDQYTAELSPRIGRTSYREQYVFVFKPSAVSYVSGYQFDDSKDWFQVEPFVAIFNSTVTGALQQFSVIPLHAKPSAAVAELDSLVDVYDDMVTRTAISDSILLGDFNAGCTYIVQGEYEKMRLYTENRFKWLISDHVDTTTKTTSCPYDRIVVAGPTMITSSYDVTAAPHYFDEALGIQANWNLVKDISDHYPVGVLLRGSVPTDAASAYPLDAGTLRMSVGADLPVQSSWTTVHTLLQGLYSPITDASSTTGPLVFTHSNFAYVEWVTGTIDAAGEQLLQLAQASPHLITDEAVAVLGYKAGQGAVSDPSLYAPDVAPKDVRLNLLCRNEAEKPKCSLSLSAATKIN